MMKQEQRLQEMYANWLTQQQVLFCASAGGMRTSMRTAINMKRAGYKKGYPDIAIHEPRGGFHGMFVEVKCGSRATPEQIGWRNALINRGYYAIIVPSKLISAKALDYLIEMTASYLEGKAIMTAGECEARMAQGYSTSLIEANIEAAKFANKLTKKMLRSLPPQNKWFTLKGKA
jgi:hypothetical protein